VLHLAFIIHPSLMDLTFLYERLKLHFFTLLR